MALRHPTTHSTGWGHTGGHGEAVRQARSPDPVGLSLNHLLKLSHSGAAYRSRHRDLCIKAPNCHNTWVPWGHSSLDPGGKAPFFRAQDQQGIKAVCISPRLAASGCQHKKLSCLSRLKGNRPSLTTQGSAAPLAPLPQAWRGSRTEPAGGQCHRARTGSPGTSGQEV